MYCFAPGCRETANPLLWFHVCACLPEVASLQQRLARRQMLQNNVLYPASVQVDCPRSDCMGLGYLGFDTVMCFICEHQWSVEVDVPDSSQSEGLGGATSVQRCPSCQVPISKDGGCDHMTCR